MTQILLVQHCQSEHHVNGMTGGWTDTSLTDLGQRQAASVAAALRRELRGTDYRLVSSDLMRAAQTADAISATLAIPAELVPDLREFNNGVAAGRTEEWARVNRSPEPGDTPSIDHRPFDGAETWRQFYHRIAACIEPLAAGATTPLVVVTHGGSVAQIVTWWLGIDVDRLAAISFGSMPGGVTELRGGRAGERMLARMQDRSYLAEISDRS